jgi:hypothetical protein
MLILFGPGSLGPARARAGQAARVEEQLEKNPAAAGFSFDRRHAAWPVSQASTFRPNKRVIIALRYIHGIGPVQGQGDLRQGGHRAERRVNQLTDAEVCRSAKPSTATTSSKATCAAKWR